MIFSEKLQFIRKNHGFTQEELAGKLNVSRQAVAKWESGQVYPDIFGSSNIEMGKKWYENIIFSFIYAIISMKVIY